MPGETMILHEHPHWWFFWKQVLAGVGILALAWLWVMWDGTLGTIAGWITLLALIVWAVNTIYQFAQWQTTRFAITDQRVAYQSGFFHRRVSRSRSTASTTSTSRRTSWPACSTTVW